MRLLRSWGLGVGAAVALATAICGSPTVAHGQAPVTYPECTKKPTPADVEGAKGAHKAASQFYERAEYDKAIRYWNDAYAFDCTANDLLVNIANAYEKLGDVPSTVLTLEAYLKRTGPNETIEQKVRNLRQRMAPTPSPTATTAPTVAPTAPPTASVAPTSSAPPPAGPRPYGVTPWFVAGGGGLVALIGIILLPVGYGAVSTAAAACPNHVCPKTVGSDVLASGNTGRTEVGAGWTLMTVGLAAVGGGMAWQLLYNKPRAADATAPGQPAAPKKASLWMTPTGGPGGGGVSLGGSF